MKPTAYLINVARGPVVDEAALTQALQEGWIAGAGLDVFEKEPLPAESPLWGLPNTIVSPHMAGLSERFVERSTGLLCENLGRYIRGEPMLNVLDLKRGY
jgi:phosphoglycerate dehydrogenase-like enzyme